CVKVEEDRSEWGWVSDKLDEAQALARSCAGRPDFLPCDGLSICATHSHGKCFKLHWCCHLGWCHCKYVYQPMTSVCQLPSTAVPFDPSESPPTMNLSVSLTERFLKIAPCFQSPPYLQSPKYCVIADLFIDDYIVKRINGKMCYVQHQRKHHHPSPVDKLKGPKMDHCSSPSSSEDSGINALGLHYLESCESESEDQNEELSTDGDGKSSLCSLWDQDETSLLSPSKSTVEIIEKMETTV
uniref:Chromosome 3 open reading frame 70 n=1 Tax=Salmo trutta TaxID=8032 RepID=A0A674AI77_SALTR